MKKIIISLVAINVAVLTIVFSMMPNEANADVNPDRYNADWVFCDLGPQIYKNVCSNGTKYVSCLDSKCAITIFER